MKILSVVWQSQQWVQGLPASKPETATLGSGSVWKSRKKSPVPLKGTGPDENYLLWFKGQQLGQGNSSPVTGQVYVSASICWG